MSNKEKPEALSNWDLQKVREALVVAVLALGRHGDEKSLKQIEDIIEDRARLVRKQDEIEST